MAGRDNVVPAFHPNRGGIILVTLFTFVDTRDGSVVAMRTEIVRPAVVHFATFDGDMA